MGQKIKKQFQEVEAFVSVEQDTGKVWVDGRTIYRKILRGNFTIVAGANNIAHGISGLTNSAELVSIQGGIKLGAAGLGGGATNQTFNYRETGGNWIAPVSFDASLLVFTSSFAWGNSYYNVILEYVK